VFVNTTLEEMLPAPASAPETVTWRTLSAHWPAGAFGSTAAVDVGLLVGDGAADVAIAEGDGAGDPAQPARSRTTASGVMVRRDRRMRSR
jgi:hypothetical protein